MDIQNEYSEYKLNTATEGFKDFFSSNPMKEWCFEKYIFSICYKNKLKNYNRIVYEYSDNLQRIIKLKEIPEKVKQHCSFLLSEIPDKAKLKATASKPAKKRRLNINYGAQLLFGDGNTVTNPTINYNVEKKKEEDEKKQGEDEKKEEGNEQHASFWKDWIRFLENNQNFHPYSPENHNVIRCGKNVSPRPNLDENIYKDHLKNHEKKEYELPKVCIPYLDKVFSSKSNSEYRKAIRNIPPCESDNEFN